MYFYTYCLNVEYGDKTTGRSFRCFEANNLPKVEQLEGLQ